MSKTTTQAPNYRPFAWSFLSLIHIKMRKITQQASQCLKNGQSFKQGNTKVITLEGFSEKFERNYKMARLFLHGHLLGEFTTRETGEKTLRIYDAGWQTNTTKERLNGILNAFGIADGIYQKNYKWYIGAEGWTGSKYFLV